jgi:uncharacterized protein YprB with RNaseH-like and TPR domain
MTTKPVIRFLDIETAPNIAHVWSFWDTNVGLNQVLEDGFILSFSYKDLGGDWVYYEENRSKDDKAITKKLIDALDSADIVVGHNGDRFDIPWIQGRAAIYGLNPPSPFRTIDTFRECKKLFRFPSYKLEYVSRVLGCTPKLKHKKFPGHELWLECLRDNDEAWEEMATYNMQDVETLEEVYLKIRPWIKRHPQVGMYSHDETPMCPKCGSAHINYRGFLVTQQGKYHKFQCQECGGWGRLSANTVSRYKREKLGRNCVQ